VASGPVDYEDKKNIETQCIYCRTRSIHVLTTPKKRKRKEQSDLPLSLSRLSPSIHCFPDGAFGSKLGRLSCTQAFKDFEAISELGDQVTQSFLSLCPAGIIGGSGSRLLLTASARPEHTELQRFSNDGRYRIRLELVVFANDTDDGGARGE
jgi:hypothetical protein